MKSTKGNADTLKGECQMSLEILEAKEAIREVIDGFANLECNVPAQMVYFTEDVHVMVYMGDKLTMNIHGRIRWKNSSAPLPAASKHRTIKMVSRSLRWMAIRLWTYITAGRPS